jgi:transcriptional regulator with XRE-family HTH domain
MDIGKRVSDIINQKNISQAELSRLTGIHPSLVCKLVKDQRRWNQDQIFAVARALDINPKILFDENNYHLQEESFPFFQSNQIIDLDILAQAIQQAETFIQSQKIKISPERKSRLVLKLYEHWLIEKEPPDSNLTRRYFHLT